MAGETKSIKIHILKESNQNNNNTKKTEKSENQEFASDLNQLLHPIKTMENKTVGKVALLSYAYNNAKELIQNMAQSTAQRYMGLTEDYISENAIKITKNVTNKFMSITGSIVSGASVGAMAGGPAGAIAGASVGAVFGAANFVIDRINTTASFYRSLNETNYNTQFSATRASLVDNGRGTEN